jgi:uncharacterized protein with PIN domain
LILVLDTSALVKIYISEPGSERMREAVARDEPKAASVLAFAEMHATFARRRREELLLPTELEQIRGSFGDDWEKLTQIPVGEAVAPQKGTVPSPMGMLGPCLRDHNHRTAPH